jgi:hypothetical protein
VILNNQSVKVRVVARDAACNAGADTSDANFTIWNPPASFTHMAEAPFYVVRGGFESYIHMCNTTSSTIIVELDFRKPSGEATPGAPVQILLAREDARRFRVADYLTPGTLSDPNNPNILEGSIRLRHNGATDGDVRAMVAVSKYGDEQSFAAPFIYPATAQGSQ